MHSPVSSQDRFRPHGLQILPAIDTVVRSPSPRWRSGPERASWLLAATISLLFFAVAPALAQTMPLPGDEARVDRGNDPTGPPRSERVVWPTGRINWLLELDRTVRFLDVWQYRGVGSNFGGMIEAEGGPLGGVIQTDNTLEAIWVWSHYKRLTGTTAYDDNIADAWTYCQVWPAWLEEGGNGYYRVHNCAWALTAESEYRAATADTSFKWYGRTSAEYIRSTPLFLNQSQRLNAMVQGWAAGNLYVYAEELGNPTWRQKALDYGETMINWIAVNPAVNLSFETWAMSAGTIVWGICNSVFRNDQPRGALWVQNNGALVDTFQVWYNVPNDTYDWDNSWNVAYCNAHFAMGEVSGNPHYTAMGEKLTRKLNAYDTDDDGGIMATTQDPPTIDMSWVSCYLAKFGYARLLGTPAPEDAGILAFTSPADGDTILWPVGIPIPVRVQASNFGLQSLAGVEIHVVGPVNASASIDLGYVEVEEVELDPGWVPPAPGLYEFTAYTVYPGDGNAANDSLTIRVYLLDSAGAEEALTLGPRILTVWPNPVRERALISLAVPAGQAGRVDLFSLDGRRVTSWRVEPAGARTLHFAWGGPDSDGRSAPPGIYFVRAQCGDQALARKLVRLTP